MPETSTLELHQALQRIEHVMRSSPLLRQRPGPAQIAQYYRRCRPAYRLLHSRRGFIHVGLSRGNRFRQADLHTSAELVRDQIQAIGARDILELAPGLGANSAYLARSLPDLQFTGLDLSFEPLPAYGRLPNYSQKSGDYHDLSRFAAESFDVVFVIEALCYSERKDEVLEQVSRVLRPGGRFVVIDGYAAVDPDASPELRELHRQARRWTDRAMALPEMEAIDSFRQKLNRSSLCLREERDLSAQTLPTLRVFERRARIYFYWPLVARVLNRLLPEEILQNAAAGLLMRPLVDRAAYVYRLHILEKPLRGSEAQ